VTFPKNQVTHWVSRVESMQQPSKAQRSAK